MSGNTTTPLTIKTGLFNGNAVSPQEAADVQSLLTNVEIALAALQSAVAAASASASAAQVSAQQVSASAGVAIDTVNAAVTSAEATLNASIAAAQANFNALLTTQALAALLLQNIPTTLPATSGILWNNGGALAVS